MDVCTRSLAIRKLWTVYSFRFEFRLWAANIILSDLNLAQLSFINEMRGRIYLAYVVYISAASAYISA